MYLGRRATARRPEQPVIIGQESLSNVEVSGLRYVAQIRSTAGLEGQINERPLSFTFWRIAGFARFEG